eukprot:2977446-Karenia_brevis.AAC.1
MASLLGVHRIPHLPKYAGMPSYRGHMTVKSLRHWPEDIFRCMHQPFEPLLMTSAASAEVVRHGS